MVVLKVALIAVSIGELEDSTTLTGAVDKLSLVRLDDSADEGDCSGAVVHVALPLAIVNGSIAVFVRSLSFLAIKGPFAHIFAEDRRRKRPVAMFLRQGEEFERMSELQKE